MNNARVFVVCGPVQHGKSTLARWISATLGQDFGDCSSVIYREVASRRGITEAELRAMPKEDIRSDLIATGDDLCDPDPGFLAKQLYYGEAKRSIAGVRRRTELASLVEAVGDADVISIWIERPDGPSISDNTDFGLKEACPIHVANVGGVASLRGIGEAIGQLQYRPECNLTFSPLGHSLSCQEV